MVFFYRVFGVLLLSLFFVGYRLLAQLLLFQLAETIVAGICSSLTIPVRFLAILPLQQLLDRGYYMYHLRLLTKSFYTCIPLPVALREAENLFGTISYYYLYLCFPHYYLFCLGLVIGEPTLICLFVPM
jgi:hypothetical protein